MRSPRPDVPVAALVAEAARRSGVCWVDAGAGPRLVWHAWYAEAVVVVSGDDQVVEGLDAASEVGLVLRAKDGRTRLVGCRCSVERVAPDDDRWEDHARALLGVRLNLADPARTLERWRDGALVARIVPLPDH